MYLNDLNSSRHNVEKLNRILADTFKHDVDLSQMTTDSLNRMLNTTNAKMTAIKESDLKYWENPQYNKLGLIQHQLKTYITEIAPTRSDGKKMKTKESTVMEADLDQAEVLLAAQELVDEMQKMVEDVAEMQVQKLMPIVDAMKEQVGFEVAEQYNTAADGALGALLDQMKTAKEAVENATLAARGEPVNAPATTDMGADVEEPMDMDADMEAPDEFGGDDAASGEENPVGRELKGESALANMERGALAEKKFLESKDRLFKMVESGQMSQEHFINVINELDEGFLDNLKAVGKVAGGGLAKGLGYMLTRDGDRRAQDGGFSDRLGRGLTNIGNDAYDSGMDTLSKSVSGYAKKRNDLRKLTNSAEVTENPKFGGFSSKEEQERILNIIKNQGKNRGPETYPKTDIPINRFAPPPTGPGGDEALPKMKKPTPKPKTRPDGTPFNRFAPPPTGPGGDQPLPKMKKIGKDMPVKQAPAPIDGGIAPGTTKGGPSKLRQRQMQKQANDAFLKKRLDQRYQRGEFAPKPQAPAPLDGGIAPGTTKGGPSLLRQRQMKKQAQQGGLGAVQPKPQLPKGGVLT